MTDSLPITSADVQERMESFLPLPADTPLPSISVDHQRLVRLDRGLTLYGCDHPSAESGRHQFNAWRMPFVGFVYLLSGGSWASCGTGTRARKRRKVPGGLLGMFRHGGELAIHHKSGLRCVVVCVDPERLNQLLGDGVSLLPRSWSAATTAKGLPRQIRQPLTPFTRMTAHETLRDLSTAPNGSRLLLESRALALIATFMQGLTSNKEAAGKPRQHSFSTQDRERLHTARIMLRQELAAPPTIQSLAQKVGMCDCNLKRLFKTYYGTTIYGFVRQERMQQARNFIDQGMKVSHAANQVGYSNFSHFSSAFRKYYGVLPSVYQQQK